MAEAVDRLVGEGVYAERSVVSTGAGRPSMAVRELQLLLVLADAAILALLAGAVSFLALGPSSYIALALPLIIAWTAIGFFAGMYDASTFARTRASAECIAWTGLITAAVLLFIFYVHPFVVSRENVLILALAAPGLLTMWRAVAVSLVGRMDLERRVLIVGAGRSARALLKALADSRSYGIRVVGLVDDDPRKRDQLVAGVPVLGSTGEAWQIVQRFGVEQVVLAVAGPKSRELLEGLSMCYEGGVAVALMPHLYEEVSGQVPVEHMGPHWLGAVPLSHPGGRLWSIAKRALDIAVSGSALLLTAPVMAIVALLVKLSSPGPIFFRQDRIGLHGRLFSLLKFRTMYIDRPAVTPIGAWLRRAHLDELPQFFLVLRGDMSLVGPRPKRADQARELEERIPLYRVRYSVRPGLTGWAQIAMGYAHSEDDEMAKLRYDLFYIKHQSPIFDALIILRTFSHVLGLRGF